MNITIVGLDLVGASIALALRAATKEIPITGHDPDPARVSRAKKLGAIQKSHWNLPAACEDADLVLLALPLPELEKTLAALGDGLREGTVVLDTAPLKRPVMDWAAEHLPAAVQFIGGHPVLQGLPGAAEPSADLLQGARFYLVAPAGASARAVDLAANLAVAVGAEALFTDAVEHDGLMAATQQLPLLITLALMETLQNQPGWEDRLASLGGELSSLATSLGQPEVGMEIGANVDHLLPWLDALMARLAALSDSLHTGGASDLAERLAQATARYTSGLQAQRDQTGERTETRPDGWRSFLLGGLGRRG